MWCSIISDFMSRPTTLVFVAWDKSLFLEADASQDAIGGWAWQHSFSDAELESIPANPRSDLQREEAPRTTQASYERAQLSHSQAHGER